MRYFERETVRVLIVSGAFPSSHKEVAGSFVYDEAWRISKRNVKVYVARGLRSVRCPKRNLMVDGIYVHNFSRMIDLSLLSLSMKAVGDLPIRSFFRPETVFFTVPYSWFLVHITKKYKIDVIHAHFAYPEGFAGLLAKKATGKPLIVTLHGVDILTEPSINYGIRLKTAYDEMVRMVLEQADRVFGASRFVCQEALNAGCDRERLIYFPNGVDLKRFNPKIDGSFVRKRISVTHRPMIFTLRAHEAKNGIEYLIKAIPLVLREVPNALFVIGGDGSLRAYHQGLVHKLKVNKQCIFVGRIPQSELPYYYGACDIFVIPSIIEAFGLVTVEAMACGRPVIGSNVGGIPDIIKDGLNGFLVKPRDPEDLAKKIVFLLKNPDLMKNMGIEGRKIAEEKFDIKKRIEKVLAVYARA